MKEILIEKAILHILDSNIGTPVLSEKVLPRDESEDFFKKHIGKLFDDSELKECVFDLDENHIRELIANISDDNFIFTTQQLAAALYDIMSSNADIPAADVLFAAFSYENARYLGLIKFNYKEAYTHSLATIEGVTATSMIKYRALYASEAQKVDECVFINLNDHAIKIKEKKIRNRRTKGSLSFKPVYEDPACPFL